MKKLFTIIALIMLSISAMTQVHVIQTELARVQMYSSDIEAFEPWCDVIDSDVIIKIDVSNDLISIDNNYDDRFKILSVSKTINGKDSDDGDPWAGTIFNAIDNDGVKLKVFVQVFDSGPIAVLVSYINIRYKYQGHLINFNASTTRI